jgi:orotate phosphoribosyltransferase
VVDVVKERGAEVVAVGMLVDRSGGKVEFGVPAVSMLTLEVPAYPSEDCPMCRDGKPLTLPKSAGGD